MGIGKATVIKVLLSGNILKKLGDQHMDPVDTATEAIKFASACYGMPGTADMTSLRYSVWSSKMSNPRLISAPQLNPLPPTTEASEAHVLRAHLQTGIWKAALEADPPILNPVHYG